MIKIILISQRFIIKNLKWNTELWIKGFNIFVASVSMHNSQDHTNYISTIVWYFLNFKYLNAIIQSSRNWEKIFIFFMQLIEKTFKKLPGKAGYIPLELSKFNLFECYNQMQFFWILIKIYYLFYSFVKEIW